MRQQLEMAEIQKLYLKDKYLKNERCISKLEREIKMQSDSLDNNQKVVSSLLLSKQVMYYDHKMSKLKESFKAPAINKQPEQDNSDFAAQQQISELKEKIWQTKTEKEQLLKLEQMMIDQFNSEKSTELSQKP